MTNKQISDEDREIGVVIHFLHPDYNIPCVAGWDEEGEVLMFDLEDYYAAVEEYGSETTQVVGKWCMQNAINCSSIWRANTHLSLLGVKAEFIE